MAKMDDATRMRVLAGRLMLAGKTPAEAAKAVGVARQTAYTWKARLDEGGSGVDPSRSFFRVDGKRMPSEWDSEEHTLRWRPLHAPRRGAHRFEAQVADRAGNSSRVSGSFVID